MEFSLNMSNFANNDVQQSNDFNQLRISIASPEQIKSWSYGEVCRPETINYRTFKPEKDGLFCAKIFGPVKDHECLCGKYKRIKYKGIVCEKCGVEVTTTKARRERMGHIDLASPVVHIWFLKSLPSRVSTILDMQLKIVERVLYFESYLVVEPGITPLGYLQVISESQYQKAITEYGLDSFKAMIGAEAIQYALKSIDLEKEDKLLREEIEDTTSEIKKKKLLKKLKLIENFIKSGNKPEHMVLEILPVIPPNLRPLVPLDGGRFATSDLNELYRRVINRNCRLKRLCELKAPDIIIRNEKRMLQQSVDALLDNGKKTKSLKNAAKRPFKSLSDMLKGKQGRFRQNLLGKRVDYSGRSVIVVGPELKLYQCGLPKKMALELFKPFIYAKLELYGLSNSIRAAKKLVEAEIPEVWDVLEEVIKEHPVLLNRAPTLHRLSIQAFEPILIEGKAIQLHPLVCTAFNADFDGDQMAVHVPISFEAQIESIVLMLSINNILSPASGKPIIVPSQDMVLGLYFLTLEVEGDLGNGKIFCDIYEVEHALEAKVVSLHAKIKVRIEEINEQGEVVNRIVDTTPGRAILYELLPKKSCMKYEEVNKVITSKEISRLLDKVYRFCGQNDTIEFVDKVMSLGFEYSTKSGVSIGKEDMVIPSSKKKHIENTLDKIKEFEVQYRNGIITSGERYNKVVDAWSICTEQVAGDMMKSISEGKTGAKMQHNHNDINSIYMMAHSGARGSESQIKQLAGMRGLMTKPSGEIIETPIIANFKEGLNVLEYFNSAHGARKGLADTALKTANSGYLTRRLVDVAQNCIITEYDCGTKIGITVGYDYNDGVVLISLEDKILGRVVLEDIKSGETGEVVVKAKEVIDEDNLEKIISLGVDQIKIRSPLMCKAKIGFCCKCYGRDLSTGMLVNEGESVGVIAAQSIGEPGTQLTMRTFHIGGAASSVAEQSNIQSTVEGIVKYDSISVVKDRNGLSVVLNRRGVIIIEDSKGNEKIRYKLSYGYKLLVKEGEAIKKGQMLSEWDPYNIPIITEVSGTVKFHDLYKNVSYKEVFDETTSISNQIVIDWKMHNDGKDLVPSINVNDDNDEIKILDNGIQAQYFMFIDAIMNVEDGQKIQAGDIIAKIPKQSSRVNDITGGLPRVAELFEARKPKNHSIICEADGVIKFGKDYKSKRRVILTPDDNPLEPLEYFIPKGKHIAVREGDRVKRGDLLMEGTPVPQDILKVLGVEAFSHYMSLEVQKVYRLQGVPINNKHIEVIISQMLRKVEVVDSGDTNFIEREIINKEEYEKVNAEFKVKGHKALKVTPVLQGITKASLETDSFISAASFQETTKVLTEAAIQGKVDRLVGLKENVIVGRLIPAGTGYYAKKLQEKFE